MKDQLLANILQGLVRMGQVNLPKISITTKK